MACRPFASNRIAKSNSVLRTSRRAECSGVFDHEALHPAVSHRQRHRSLPRGHLRPGGSSRCARRGSRRVASLPHQQDRLASPSPLLVESPPPSLPLTTRNLLRTPSLVQCLVHCTFFHGSLDQARGNETSTRNPGALSLSSTSAPCSSAMAATRLRPKPLPGVERSRSRR